MKSLSGRKWKLRVLTEAFSVYRCAVKRFESETGIVVCSDPYIQLCDVDLDSLNVPVNITHEDMGCIQKSCEFNGVEFVTVELKDILKC